MQPESVAAIIDLLIERDLLAELGMERSHARTIKARNAIPAHWHAKIVALAGRHGLPIDLALLARLAEEREFGPRQPAEARQ
jgi:hypothetical protein